MSCCEKNASGAACQLKPGVCPVKRYLANLAVWNAKLHNLHWNVVGGAFVQVHEFTESLYDEVNEQYDAVAEGAKMRGNFPLVRLTEYLEIATIEEIDSRDYPVEEVVDIILADMLKMRDLAEVIRNGAEEQGDYLRVAQFEGYLEKYAKNIWFLKAMQKR